MPTDDWNAITPPPQPDITNPETPNAQDETAEPPNEQRRQPELDRTQSTEKAKLVETEFETDLKKPPANRSVQLTQFEQQAHQLARHASMDSNDGIDM